MNIKKNWFWKWKPHPTVSPNAFKKITVIAKTKNEVTIPEQYTEVTEFILNRKVVSEKLLLTEFKSIPENLIYECLENLKNMKVLN